VVWGAGLTESFYRPLSGLWASENMRYKPRVRLSTVLRRYLEAQGEQGRGLCMSGSIFKLIALEDRGHVHDHKPYGRAMHGRVRRPERLGPRARH